MAYMTQQIKADIMAIVKPIAESNGVRLTLAIEGHCKLICTIHSYDTLQLPYSLYTLKGQSFYGTMQNGSFSIPHGLKALNFFSALMKGLNYFNYCHSDIMADYFNAGYYVELRFSERLKLK